jgi:hypothetical protein
MANAAAGGKSRNFQILHPLDVLADFAEARPIQFSP